eukprot:8726793-Lingulodinium_polyedra.AAC.1
MDFKQQLHELSLQWRESEGLKNLKRMSTWTLTTVEEIQKYMDTTLSVDTQQLNESTIVEMKAAFEAHGGHHRHYQDSGGLLGRGPEHLLAARLNVADDYRIAVWCFFCH